MSVLERKAVSPEYRKFNDDYEQVLEEFADLAETKYRDSLVLGGLKEAEEEDFARRLWPKSFVVRLREFLANSNDGSVSAISLQEALNSAELIHKGIRYRVWLGPLARQWLRDHARQLRAFLSGRYQKEAADLWERT